MNTSIPSDALGFETRAIHAGQDPEPASGAVTMPIYQTSTYAQSAVGVHKGYDYARTDNPTRTALQECLASLERGRFGLTFASGMAAITTLMLYFKQGDHVVVADDVYGGTYRLFQRVFTNFGLEFSFVDMTDAQATRAAFRPNTRLVWIESPTNPLLKIVDIAAISALAREHNARVGVDNTFASPYLQRPLELGADLVMHSTTKYLGGHSDVVGGAIVTSDAELYERLKFLQNAAGAVPAPLDCWLVLRGLKTLALRVERHSANALRVAQWLEKQAHVTQVIYPGLPSHPQHAVACKQMRTPDGTPAFGGMISFIAKGGPAMAEKIAARTRIFTLAESLGGVESLIEVPAAMTHTSVANSPLAVNPGLVRLSVGIESVADLMQDLQQALENL
ncbi:MAG: cystathionine gamma-synthase [Chloroflexi bacterium]|nr:cystathionine gamma-synthase [Chloroflexota bacterium]